ncbi:glycosyltransferase family 2 protein [Fundidesulfovibrio agrisoli]|uniref:glycosyltransferase family 2 protein n=1 Tax=Fundidesulfovibrio agrisoli TaxID=2922717 RepID=UPI001FAE28F6|nr:glycosyltransferase family 2 protein [Fundidesulfovibrio agrisoli]
MSADKKLVSMLIPAYNEEDNVLLMHQALVEAAGILPEFDFEFLFIDDGSSDRTFERLESIHEIDPRVKVVRLTRNFGSHAAVSVGLDYASGDAGVIIPCDLQDHPREVGRFLEKWREGYHVVWGMRAERKDRALDVFFSRAFAQIIRRIAIPDYPSNGTGSFCLMDRKVMDALRSYPERNRMTFGLILTTGYRQVFIPYNREERRHGVSKYSLGRKIKLLLDAVVSFSSTPIRMATWTGVALAIVSVLYALYIAVYRMFYDIPVQGWTTLLVAVLLLGGVQLMVLGMLGEYVWRTLDDVRRRPLYLVWESRGDFPRAKGLAEPSMGREGGGR